MLIENTDLPDEYILGKIVQMAKQKGEQREDAGRVFIFPTL